MGYFKLSLLLYACLIGTGLLLWQYAGILPTTIFYGVGNRTLFIMGLFFFVIICTVQFLAYVLYKLIEHNKKP